MRKFLLFLIITIFFISGNLKADKIFKSNHTWVEIASNLKEEFFYSPEAIKIGENILIYQDLIGGFPKNYYMPDDLTPKQIIKIDEHKTSSIYSSIDNSATTTEIIYLARLYNATKDERYKYSALKGINFLINNQLKNGCWAQCPSSSSDKKYQSQITYNDNAMINVLNLLSDAAYGEKPFEFINQKERKLIKKSLNNGIGCVIKTQIPVNDQLTLWAAQYNRNTLKPCQGRKFEPPSIDGGKESANIVLFLMNIKHPTPEIINSVELAVKSFENLKITGLERKYFIDSKNRYDYKMVKCSDCAPIWARFYSLENQKPIFENRDQKKCKGIEDLSYERRNGYEWYSYDAQKVLDEYPKWKARITK